MIVGDEWMLHPILERTKVNDGRASCAFENRATSKTCTSGRPLGSDQAIPSFISFAGNSFPPTLRSNEKL